MYNKNCIIIHNAILSAAMISVRTKVFASAAAAVAAAMFYAHVSVQNTIRDYQDDLSALENSSVTYAFSSAAACKEQGFDKIKCVQAFENAKKWSETNAVIPMYKSDHECEEVFLSCRFKDVSVWETVWSNPTRDGVKSLARNLRFATRYGGSSSGGGLTEYTPDMVAFATNKNLEQAVPLNENRDGEFVTFSFGK